MIDPISNLLEERTKRDLRLLQDPLSDPSRRERKALLGASLLALAMTKAGLIPTEISAFGIKTSALDQSALFLLIALVTAYFLVAFVIYAGSDFIAWRIQLAQDRVCIEEERAHLQQLVDRGHEPENESESLEEAWRIRNSWSPRALAVGYFRGLLEFGIPVLAGTAALVSALCAA